MKPLSTYIVPAQPGFYTVYDVEDIKKIEIGEPVIAWRIETHLRDANDEAFSSCFPLTADGEPGSNCIGVQNPDMTVTVFHDTTFRTLADFQADRYPKD